MSGYVIVSFYKFVTLTDVNALKPPMLASMTALNLKGTIILADEGINGSVCGSAAALTQFTDMLNAYAFFADLTFQFTHHAVNPFSKAKVKLRKEIVTLGQPTVHPGQLTGIHVAPNSWNALIADPSVIVIDTRNDYEVKLGTFKHAINPVTDNFRDFPSYVDAHLTDKNKKIAMFCTGGIRCEKSTAYLRQLGFDEVYQLHGGILNYLASVPDNQSLWQGHCFVFDDRVALDAKLQSLEQGSIDKEWKNNHKKKPK